MSPATLLVAVARLQGELEDLLASFESGELPDEACMDASARALQGTFAGLQEQLQARSPGALEDGEVEKSVEHLLRLYAVASGVLVQRRDGLAVERATCVAARQRVRRILDRGQSGDSCDVQG